MTTDNTQLTSEEFQVDEAYATQFAMLRFLELLVSIATIGYGLIVLVGGISYPILRSVGIISTDIPELAMLTGQLFLGFLAIGLGFGTYNVDKSLKEYDVWAFSNTLYLNLILLVLYAIIGGLAGLILIIIAIPPLLFLFLPHVREFWFPSFREDLTPRLKEIRYSLYLIRKSPLVLAGIVILATFVALAFLAPYIAPYGPEQRVWDDINLPPVSPSNVEGNPMHWWGTDNSGGDTFSRILYAAQVDLRVSITVVIVAVIVGTLIGAISGYYGGKIDELVMRITDVFFAFPGLILAMAIVMALGSRSLDNISLSLMVTWWPSYARLVRGQVLAEREKLYVEAARSVGASDSRILLNHIIPNTIQPLIVQATMDTGAVLLVAAGLSFIGFGPPAGVAEWGLMISNAERVFGLNPWAMFFPGMAILFVSLSLNLVGDGIRDIMDPKLRRR